MQEAAKEILGALETIEGSLSDTREVKHLLEVFRTLLQDDSALEDEAFFMEHGYPREASGMSLADLFAPLPDAPVPPPLSDFDPEG